jgi:hypothetical protein
MTARHTIHSKPRAIAVALPMDGSPWGAALLGLAAAVLACGAALLLLR